MAPRRPSVVRALAKALAEAKPEPHLEATVMLARRYALEIDADPERLWKLGPQMLTVLAALGMTKAAAAGVTSGGGSGVDAGSGSVAKFREQARALRSG